VTDLGSRPATINSREKETPPSASMTPALVGGELESEPIAAKFANPQERRN